MSQNAYVLSYTRVKQELKIYRVLDTQSPLLDEAIELFGKSDGSIGADLGVQNENTQLSLSFSRKNVQKIPIAVSRLRSMMVLGTKTA